MVLMYVASSTQMVLGGVRQGLFSTTGTCTMVVGLKNMLET